MDVQWVFDVHSKRKTVLNRFQYFHLLNKYFNVLFYWSSKHCISYNNNYIQLLYYIKDVDLIFELFEEKIL